MIETPVRNALLVSALVLGLVVALPTVSPGGSTLVNVGGEVRGYESSSSPASNKVRERSQPVNTGSTSSDPSNRLIDRAQTGSTKSADKASTTPAPNGTYQEDPGEYSKPGGTGEYGRPTSPFCSTTDITIGEERRTTLRCPGGTIR
jgi:hypothetical protein